MRRWLLIGTLWVFSVLVAGMVGYAQVRIDGANIISGQDFGFVVEHDNNKVAYGRLMVRVNGEWRPAIVSTIGGFVPGK